MDNRLIVYSCHKDQERHARTMEHLRAFADWVNGNCSPDVALKPANGNKEFPATADLLGEAMRKLRQADGACPFMGGLSYLVLIARLYQDGSEPYRDKLNPSPDKDRMAVLWEERGTGEIASSLSGNVLVVADKIVSSITEAPQAHGITGDRLCLLVQDYKNILWHEVAHLFGAEDHYRRDDHNRPAPECKDQTDQPQLRWCLMQWDPGVKDCRFCAQTIEEIRNYFAKQKARREMRKCPQKAN